MFSTIHFNYQRCTSNCKVKAKVTQSCPPLCNPMDYTVHEILQARILEWVAFSFTRGPSQTRDRTQVSGIAGRFFTSWATKEALSLWIQEQIDKNIQNNEDLHFIIVPLCFPRYKYFLHNEAQSLIINLIYQYSLDMKANFIFFIYLFYLFIFFYIFLILFLNFT